MIAVLFFILFALLIHFNQVNKFSDINESVKDELIELPRNGLNVCVRLTNSHTSNWPTEHRFCCDGFTRVRDNFFYDKCENGKFQKNFLKDEINFI